MRLDDSGEDAGDHQQNEQNRKADAPGQRFHRAVGLALVDHHVIQPGTQVPDDQDDESDNQQFFHGIHRLWLRLAIIRDYRRIRLKAKLFLLLLAVLVELALLRLGFWQLARGREKQEQLDQVAEVLDSRQGIALASMDMTSRSIEWAEGPLHFPHGPLLMLDNQRRGNAVGVSVYQTAERVDGSALLVDLGWLPVAGDRQLPKPRPLTGKIHVQGLLMPPPSMGLAMGPAISEQPDGSLLLTRLDIRALAERRNQRFAERVLRLDPQLPFGFARDLQVQSNTLTPEKHRGYAMQWFGLAAAFAVLCFGFWRRKK